MYHFFTKLLNMSLTAGILALAVMVLRLCLRKVPKKFICILWALVAVRLVCPVGISSSLSVFNFLHTEMEDAGQVEYFRYNEKTEKPEILFDVPALVNDDLATDSMTIGTHTSDVYLPTIIWIWILGAAGMLFYALLSYLQLRKEISASLCRKDNIYVCDDIASPFILGILRPRIYLPSGMSEATEENILAHEAAHLQRYDHWWKPLGYILLAIHWFNPILWIAYILLCRDMEAACDEKVIAGMDKEHVAAYAAALLSCATQRRRFTVCPVAFGETDVKERVKNVLHYKKSTFWVICAAMIACIAVAVCFLTNPNADSDILGKYHGSRVVQGENIPKEVAEIIKEINPSFHVDEYKADMCISGATGLTTINYTRFIGGFQTDSVYTANLKGNRLVSLYDNTKEVSAEECARLYALSEQLNISEFSKYDYTLMLQDEKPVGKWFWSKELSEALQAAAAQVKATPQNVPIDQRFQYYYDAEIGTASIRVYTHYYIDGAVDDNGMEIMDDDLYVYNLYSKES